MTEAQRLGAERVVGIAVDVMAAASVTWRTRLAEVVNYRAMGS
jgi:hypothetical protein